mgnify:CR=1 FL=1
MSVAVYNHYKRIIHEEENDKKDDDVEIQKSNICRGSAVIALQCLHA